MDALTIAAASGLQARMDSLEMLANNMANAATDGYKTDREGYSLYLAPEAAPGREGNPFSETLPVVERQWTDFSQGTLRSTGNPLDLALSGSGFFAVNGPSGPLFTRNGGFQLSASGQLITQEGYPVRAAGGKTIQATGSGALEIATDGTVRQDGKVLGQLEVVNFSDSRALAKAGKNYFQNVNPASSPAPAANVEVHQGKLEGSNTNVAESAVRLIGVMRQFEMLQKAISMGGEMNRKAVEEVARVGS